MEQLQILVNDVFNEQKNYKEGEYLVIMNILKEAYHILKGDYGNIIADKELESTTDEDAFGDSDSDSDSGYLGSGYLTPY